MDDKNLQIETLAIHGGQQHDPSTGAVMPPIYQTSTYVQEYPESIRVMNTAEVETQRARP